MQCLLQSLMQAPNTVTALLEVSGTILGVDTPTKYSIYKKAAQTWCQPVH